MSLPSSMIIQFYQFGTEYSAIVPTYLYLLYTVVHQTALNFVQLKNIEPIANQTTKKVRLSLVWQLLNAKRKWTK